MASTLIVSVALIVTAAVVVAPPAILAILGARSRRAAPRSPVPRGALAPCPSSPNCVSSNSGDPRHAVEPIPLGTDPDGTWRRLRDAVLAMPRARIVRDGPAYLHAEFVSKVFGLADDVEFLLDRSAGRIQVRSASRVGWHDFRVNRARVREIARRLSGGAGP